MSEIYSQAKVEAAMKAIAEMSKPMKLNLLELREACRALAHSADAMMAERARGIAEEEKAEEPGASER